MSNRMWLQNLKERIWNWLAWRLPPSLVYYAVIRAGVNASTGEWSGDNVPGVTIADVIGRWHKVAIQESKNAEKSIR